MFFWLDDLVSEIYTKIVVINTKIISAATPYSVPSKFSGGKLVTNVGDRLVL